MRGGYPFSPAVMSISLLDLRGEYWYNGKRGRELCRPWSHIYQGEIMFKSRGRATEH